ncbi:MAG: hypothetical protein KF715_07650 [Candidatus Didemnitutus sp.]|nr:hypothetical protein [Candidatus Didemnitutus sp.]
MIAVALAIVVGVVAAFFGALVIGAILVVAGLFALFGRGRFAVNVNRAPGPREDASPRNPPPPGGDVIDVETRKVESPPHELT